MENLPGESEADHTHSNGIAHIRIILALARLSGEWVLPVAQAQERASRGPPFLVSAMTELLHVARLEMRLEEIQLLFGLDIKSLEEVGGRLVADLVDLVRSLTKRLTVAA